MQHLPQQLIEPKIIDWTDLPNRYMNPGELETLVALVSSVNPKTVIEFGINSGRTAKCLLREIPSIKKYVGIDVLPGYVTNKMVQRKEVPPVAGELVKDDPRVELIVRRLGSHEINPEELPKADAIFIDGDHSREGVQRDTYLAHSILNKKGIVVWHDYNFVRNRDGTSAVDVAEVLHEFRAAGADIIHATGTWLAFQRA